MMGCALFCSYMILNILHSGPAVSGISQVLKDVWHWLGNGHFFLQENDNGIKVYIRGLSSKMEKGYLRG